VITENVVRPDLWNVSIQAVDIGHSTAQNNDIGIEDIDDTGQRARHTMFVTLQCSLRLGLTIMRHFDNGWCVGLNSGPKSKVMA
jgi:hypothetical protein